MFVVSVSYKKITVIAKISYGSEILFLFNVIQLIDC
jgi:hypothetical protein